MSERHRAAWIGAAVVAAGLTLAGCSGTPGTPTAANPATATSSVAAAPTSSAPQPRPVPGVEESLLHGRVDQFDAHPEAGQSVIGERATVGAGVEIHRHTLSHQVSFGLGDVVGPVAQMIQSGTVRGVLRAARRGPG